MMLRSSKTKKTRNAWNERIVLEGKAIENQIVQLKGLREITERNRREFTEHFGIPLRTVEDWESGRRKMPTDPITWQWRRPYHL